MKKIVTSTIMLIVLAFSNQISAQTSKDKNEIKEVIAVYQKALVTANASLAASLYTKNAKFMPQGGPTATDTIAIKGSYEYVFSMITPNIVFSIDEIIFVGKSAFVTSTSNGTSLVKANSKNVPEINREFFLFEKENGVWKIARYMFNKMS